MDTKRVNIYVGSILGALLLFLLLTFFSGLIYFGPEHAGEEEEVLAYAIPVEEPSAGGEEPKGPDWGTLLAQADPAAGEKVFNKCKACHSIEKGEHGVGPSLYGVVGHDIASVEAFSYSDAVASLEGDWTFEKLTQWLQDPQGFASGTKMNFSGLSDPEDVVNVIAYMNQHADSPVELSAPRTAKAEEAGAAKGEQAAEGEQAAKGEQATEGEQTAGDKYAELLAKASADEGEKIFRKCQACHTLEEGKHRVGPSLHGVIGRDIGSAEGFSYSDAMAEFEGDWTLANLMAYLEAPKDFVPGNKMTFPGLEDPQDRVNVFTYIDQSDGERDLPQPGGASGQGEQQAAQEDQQAQQGEQAAEDEQQAAAEAEEAAGGGGEYAELLANASAENGEKVFRKCQACHTLEEGKHRVGPSLYGVIGSAAGSAEGYDYSDAMAEFGEDWTLANLDGYLASPNEFIPGNKMTFPGLDDAQDRIDVFTYIDQSDGERDLPKAGAAEAGGEQQPAEAEQQAAEGEQQAAEGEQQAAAGGEFAELLANASAEEGEKVYRKCQACHTLEEGKHRVGPSLYGVIGSEAGAAEGFNYSDALKAFDEKWTLSNLDAYLENPKDFIPGNRMPFPGLKDPQDRINVLMYIDESDGERDLPQ